MVGRDVQAEQAETRQLGPEIRQGSASASSRARAAARVWCLARRSETVCASARCSSVMAIDIDQ